MPGSAAMGADCITDATQAKNDFARRKRVGIAVR